MLVVVADRRRPFFIEVELSHLTRLVHRSRMKSPIDQSFGGCWQIALALKRASEQSGRQLRDLRTSADRTMR